MSRYSASRPTDLTPWRTRALIVSGRDLPAETRALYAQVPGHRNLDEACGIASSLGASTGEPVSLCRPHNRAPGKDTPPAREPREFMRSRGFTLFE